MGKTYQSSGPSFEHSEASAGFLLWQVSMYWQRIINKVLKEYELTYTQFIVLVVTGWLKQQNKNIYQHQVARYAMIDRMMTSRILDILEKKEYVQRTRQNEDARTKQIIITKKGEDRLLQASKAVASMENDFFNPVTKSGPDFMGFMQQLFLEL